MDRGGLLPTIPRPLDDPSRDSSWTPFQQSLGRRLFKGNTHPDASGGNGAGR